MARRKQPHPQHLAAVDSPHLAAFLQQGVQAGFDSSDEGGEDEHICGKCRAEFAELGDFIEHKRHCTKKQAIILLPQESMEDLYADPLEKMDTSPAEMDDCPSMVVPKSLMGTLELDMLQKASETVYNLACKKNGLLSDTNVTLEALQNTRVAVAQHSTSEMQINALQSALCALQQQQMVQLQVIQQLQSKLGHSGQEAMAPLGGTAALTPPQSNESGLNNIPLASSTITTVPAVSTPSKPIVSTPAITAPDTVLQQTTPLENPIPPPPQEPNTLELLQRHTEQALQNTMAGSSFLLNGLTLNSSSDILRFCKGKDSEGKDDALFRHKCRFCGKVFGSDSALQIHMRSHTGERPFKCNVCGNRFTTKGNLKVHFQRHKSKYPHVQMNGEPVPEHLDSLHPPLEPPDKNDEDYPESSCSSILQNSVGTPPSIAIPPSAPPPLIPAHQMEFKLSLPRQEESIPEEVRQPQDLGSPQRSRSVSPIDNSNLSDPSDAYEDESLDDIVDKESSEYPNKLDDDVKSTNSSPKPQDLSQIADKILDIKAEDEKRENPSYPAPPFSGSGLSFPSFFNPTSFSSLGFPSVSSAGEPLPLPPPIASSPTNNIPSNMENEGTLHTDPSFYQDLLPKPGSNDNSWESLMEVRKASETTKLQQLVDNIEHKLSDPNQCIICHRVLSCKSALQMHYRTHTGERPFKCKICGRAFTTKGNLKTHMGVHRVKPPLRVLHQCPVCHKQFTNSLVLQQHIRTHTGEPGRDISMAGDVKPSSLVTSPFQHSLMPPSLQPMHQQAPLPLTSRASTPPQAPTPSSEPIPKSQEDNPESPRPTSVPASSETVIKSPHVSKESEKDESLVNNRPSSAPTPPLNLPICRSPEPQNTPYTTSLVALENHVKAINSIPQPMPFSPFNLGMQMGGFLRFNDQPSTFPSRPPSKELLNSKERPNQHHPSYSPSINYPESEGSADEARSTPSSSAANPVSPIYVTSSAPPISSTYTSPTKSESGALDLTPKSTGMSILPPTSNADMFPSPLGGLFPGSRLQTTCRYCFKTFACYSALEIHYRSHTKERPYRCDLCDRAFSTKGNMKQHMLTHKIRDLPSPLFSTTPDSSPNSSTNNASPNENKPQSKPPSKMEQPLALIQPPPPLIPTSSENPLEAPQKTPPPSSPKRPLTEGNSLTPIPKRPPGLPKHVCHVCQKPFSSASALQIHMRTHTGDKPFKCTICGRAFTTKGNLKVHMGTHMWNNCTSRRGRRMSLELPPLPPGAKPGEFLPPRPDLFFPYLPPYPNGLSTTKMNEISVIQSAGITTNGNQSPINLASSSMSEHEMDKSPNQIQDTASNNNNNPSWGWKIACNICTKICSSSSELELHQKTHHFSSGEEKEQNLPS